MRNLIIAALVAVSVPAFAENQLTDQERAVITQQQRLLQASRERAQARCIEQRGADCATEQGLSEWMLLDRSREEAVLDRVNAGVGGTTPPQPMPAVPAGAIRPAQPR